MPTKTTTTATTEQPKTKTKAWSGPRMYVGPSVARLGVTNNVVYTSYPASFLEAAEKVPRLKQLFVPILSYPDAEKSIRERSGYIWEAYMAAQAFEGGEA